MPVAVVTGGARGIGAATARRLATHGWDVAVVDALADDPALAYPGAGQDDLDETVAACGPTAIGVVADVRDQSALDQAVAAVVSRFGGCDAAVAAAGCIAGGITAWTTPEEVWATLIDVNLTGVWRLARAAVPAMLLRSRPRRGRFVAVASASGLVGMPQLAAYCASKAGVLGLTRSLAAELGTEDITVNAVAPGSTETVMLEESARIYGLSSPAELAQHQLNGRLLSPDEPAALIAWLCSEEASGVTGAVLPVDGGLTAH